LKKIKKYIFIAIFISSIFYLTSCVLMSKKMAHSFDQINIGDDESMVTEKLGYPSFREREGVIFSRYDSVGCVKPCQERLWFENKLSLDIEAWSFELDSDHRVIKKSYFLSP